MVTPSWWPVLSARLPGQQTFHTVSVPLPATLGSTGRSRGAGIRVLAVDDHKAFREALRDLVAAMPGFVLVGQASSGEEAARVAERLSPQLVLMDVAMPGMGGVAAARAILRRHPDTVVLLISIDDPAGHLEGEDLGRAVICARKQDLRPRWLMRAWREALR